MATYLMSFTYTQQGIEKVKESPARVQAARNTVRELGGEVTAFYALLGAGSDTMFIVEAPTDDAVARMALAISSRGSVRTATRRAFSEQEFRSLVADMP